MTTTLIIDDELGAQASKLAAAQGKTLEQFVVDVLAHAVTSASGLRRTARNDLPVMLVPANVPAIDPAKVRQCLEEEGI